MAPRRVVCGCYHTLDHYKRAYLPMVNLEAKATILNNTSRTHLWQIFCNPSTSEPIKQCAYTFPLYDGVSVVSFRCFVADRVLEGVVKEKAEAKRTFDEAVSKGETAGLLTQSDDAADVFSTIIGNIPAGGSVQVEICFAGELSHDAEVDGIRYTIPTNIAPRYGPASAPTDLYATGIEAKGINITVDADMRDGSLISKIESPSHNISVSLGVLSKSSDQEPVLTKASAALYQEETVLDRDFVLVVKVKGIETPYAVLETHSSLPNHRALMATLVPKFSLPQIRPEIVFIVDRSGSMSSNIPMVISAMRVFLKSLVSGIKFNICCFGSTHRFLWSKSKSYDRSTLTEAMDHVSTFQANMGGTETQAAIEAVVKLRYGDIPLEIILLTDGDITRQQSAFEYLNRQVQESKGQIRLFPLGIGSGVSHSLIQGLARAGNGFAQSVQQAERLEVRLMRMFKGALSPHITDYTLEVQYGDEDDFEMVDRVSEECEASLEKPLTHEDTRGPLDLAPKKPISLFDPSSNPDANSATAIDTTLPKLKEPVVIQAPHKLPSLFPFQRTTAYLLLSPSAIQKNPKSVMLRATSAHGPLELKIPVETLDEKGSTIHGLAARKAIQDLEEGRGWVHSARAKATGKLISEQVPSHMDTIVKREAVRLGTMFQIANRFCSFVAVDADTKKELVIERGKPHDYGVGVRNVRKAFASRGLGMFGLRSFNLNYGQPEASGDRRTQNLSQYSLTNRKAARSPSTGVTSHARSLTSHYCAPPQASLAAPFGNRNTTFGSSNAAPYYFNYMGSSSDSYDGSSTFDSGQAFENDQPRGLGVFGGSRDLSSVSRQQFGGVSNQWVDNKQGLPNATSLPADEKVRELIDKQDFEGWWVADERVASLTGIGTNDLLGNGEIDSKIWATVVVIAFLEIKTKAEEEIWEMVVEKAKAWLDSQGTNVEALQTRAKKLMGVKDL